MDDEVSGLLGRHADPFEPDIDLDEDIEGARRQPGVRGRFGGIDQGRDQIVGEGGLHRLTAGEVAGIEQDRDPYLVIAQRDRVGLVGDGDAVDAPFGEDRGHLLQAEAIGIARSLANNASNDLRKAGRFRRSNR